MKEQAKAMITVLKKEIKVRRRRSTRKIFSVIIVRSGVTLQLNANLRRYQEKNLMKLNLFMTMRVTIQKELC